MVLERIISIRDALKHPSWMFVIGGFISIICIFISSFIFPQNTGLFMVFLITLAMTPFMVNLINYEEFETEEEINRKIKLNFFQRHTDVLKIYTAFFLGMVFSLSILFLILPNEMVEKIFKDQINEINIIKNDPITGNIVSSSTFQKIILNNMSVLALCLLFAFLFGSGAIYILAWNASVLSAAIGIVANSIGGLKGVPTAFLTFFPHGSFEIAAYFIAGISGGLISAVITRKKSRLFWPVIQDGFKLAGVAAILLIIGAVIEAGIISF